MSDYIVLFDREAFKAAVENSEEMSDLDLVNAIAAKADLELEDGSVVESETEGAIELAPIESAEDLSAFIGALKEHLPEPSQEWEDAEVGNSMLVLSSEAEEESEEDAEGEEDEGEGEEDSEGDDDEDAPSTVQMDEEARNALVDDIIKTESGDIESIRATVYEHSQKIGDDVETEAKKMITVVRSGKRTKIAQYNCSGGKRWSKSKNKCVAPSAAQRRAAAKRKGKKMRLSAGAKARRKKSLSISNR